MLHCEEMIGMTRRSLIVAAMCLIVAFIAVAHVSAYDWKTYRTPDYQINYPAGWQPVFREAGMQVFAPQDPPVALAVWCSPGAARPFPYEPIQGEVVVKQTTVPVKDIIGGYKKYVLVHGPGHFRQYVEIYDGRAFRAFNLTYPTPDLAANYGAMFQQFCASFKSADEWDDDTPDDPAANMDVPVY